MGIIPDYVLEMHVIPTRYTGERKYLWGSAEQQPANPMLSPKPYFTTYSPSPTTVSFTVSSHPPPSSYRAIFLHHLSRLLRLLLFLLALSILILKYRSPSTGKSHNEPPIPLLSPILETQYRHLLPSTLILLALSVKRFSITETLLVINLSVSRHQVKVAGTCHAHS